MEVAVDTGAVVGVRVGVGVEIGRGVDVTVGYGVLLGVGSVTTGVSTGCGGMVPSNILTERNPMLW